MYGNSPRTAFELMKMDKGEKSSFDVEDFSKNLNNLHEEVKKHINKMNSQYKAKADKKRRYKKFPIGYEFMVHLQKESFAFGAYNKLKMKNFGPCKILKKHDSRNAYEVELPDEIYISAILKIFDLTKYHERGNDEEIMEALWKILAPTSKKEEIQEILDS
jgi:hypothetical protein